MVLMRKEEGNVYPSEMKLSRTVRDVLVYIGRIMMKLT